MLRMPRDKLRDFEKIQLEGKIQKIQRRRGVVLGSFWLLKLKRRDAPFGIC
jgi:predicted aconitase with swiveling domain